jgi:CheY-like chemotaxis protein
MIAPKVVLFIEDDEDDRTIFDEATSLIDPSIKRLYVTNGLEALQLLRSEAAIIPDLIFLDINMPVMNGMECLVELKKMETLQQVPVIVCSTSIYAGDQQQCEELGADFYLVKPNTLLQMSTALQFVFSKHCVKIGDASLAQSMVA